jgi:hypothetical protein
MTEQEYLDQRVKDQIDWYDKKSGWHKKRFLYLKIIEMILALAIPFLTGYITTEDVGLKVTVGFIGVVVAATAGIITLFKFQENWIQYRTVAESLKHEKFLFITRSGPYKGTASFPDFVERFESYISKENSQWASYIKPKQANSQTGTA